MDEITIYYANLICTLDGEETTEFIGVGLTIEEAKASALRKMREDEYVKCVHYQLVGAHYGIL